MHHLTHREVITVSRRLFAEHDFLRAQRNIDRHVIHNRGIRVHFQRMNQPRRINHQTVVLTRFKQAFEHVNRADKFGAVAGGRVFINLFRFANLHKLTAVHNGDTSGHGHGFFLIVGDHNAGHANALQNVHHFQLHTVTQFLIQRTHRLIKQQEFRAFCQTTGQCDTLTLTARKLMRFTLRELLHVHKTQHLRNTAGDFRLRQPVLLEAKRDVLFNGHMREQSIGLKHHIDRTQIRRHMRQIDTIEHNLPGRWLFKACQHSQQR